MFKLIKTLVGVLLSALLIAFASKAQAENLPQCTLGSGGIVTNAWVKHRIFLNEEAVFGANDLATVITHLKEMRSEGVCQ